MRESEWRECLRAIGIARPAFIVGSGSLPPGVPDDFYAQAAAMRVNWGQNFSSTRRELPLAAAIEHGVDMIKPNLREMRELTGRHFPTKDDWITAARVYINSGKVGAVALSLGHLGAMLIARDQALRSLPPSIKPISAVGAGDSFLGAVVYSLAKGEAFADAFSLAWPRAQQHLFRREPVSLPKIKSVRIDGAALQERASLGCARCVE